VLLSTVRLLLIPEEISEEQKMIMETCRDFQEKEIFPLQDRIDAQEEGLMTNLILDTLLVHIAKYTN